MFQSRQQAGQALAIAVAQTLNSMDDDRPARTVVIALSRGSVVVAKEVAAVLCAPLTILVSKLIAAPSESAVDIAAVTSTGVMVLSRFYDASIEGLPSYVRSQQIQLAKLSKTLENHWLEASTSPQPTFSGRKIVLVSEGAIDGLTELAAVRSVRASKPRLMIVAAPVISHAAERELRHECDRIVSLSNPGAMNSIIQYYDQYEHIDDKLVVELLKSANKQYFSKT